MILTFILMACGEDNGVINNPSQLDSQENVENIGKIDASDDNQEVQNDNQEVEETTVAISMVSDDPEEVFKEYFINNYSAKDMVCLVDVTHDGYQDMLVIHQEDVQQYGGYVYICKEGAVDLIYEKHGGTVHAGGFFNWYVIPRGEYWDLAEEFFGMWQGMGETSFSEYYIQNDGNVVQVKELVCPETEEDIDEDGYVKEEAFLRYVEKLGNEMPDYYCLFVSESETDAQPKEIETDPKKVFGVSDDDFLVREQTDEEIFINYVDELEKKYGSIDMNQIYPHSYNVVEGFPCFPPLNNSVAGIGYWEINDYDGDGDNELFVIRVAESKVICNIYECLDGFVYSASENVIHEISLYDKQDYCIYLKEYNGHKYIIEHDSGKSFGYVSYYKIGIWEYIGSVLEEKGRMEDMGEGNYCDNPAEEEANAAILLKEYGLVNSAETIQMYDMKLRPLSDGMKALFGFDVSNSIGEYSNLDVYFETGQITSLGSLNVHFYK